MDTASPWARKGEASPSTGVAWHPGAAPLQAPNAIPARALYESLRAAVALRPLPTPQPRRSHKTNERIRVTANLPAGLHKRLRILAAHRRQSVQQLVLAAINDHLEGTDRKVADAHCLCLMPPEQRMAMAQGSDDGGTER